MTKLADVLRDLIQSHGPLGVARFMTLALTHPRYGYYRKNDPLGRSGDFITSPEISQIFGELIGLVLADLWQRADQPRRIHLVELGPGRGTLLQDILRATKPIKGFHRALKLHLVEINESLIDVQRHTLAKLFPSNAIQWHEDIHSIPEDAPWMMVGNEFLDVLPVRQFVKNENIWFERAVGLDSAGGLTFVRGAHQPSTMFSADRAFTDGVVVETSPAREAYIADIAAKLLKANGLALFIDYAHDDEKVVSGNGLAVGDTLQAIHHGEKTAPLDHPGEADLTARVDFTALSQAALGEGVLVQGPMGQGSFLGRLGLDLRARTLSESAPDKAENIAQATHRLAAPSAMGTLFQVMAIRSPGWPAIAGLDE